MKLIASAFVLSISISLIAQSDDYCPCMDVPNYFTGSYLDSLPIDDLVAFPSVESSEAAYPVLVSESFFANDDDVVIPVELFMEQPINVSPSDLYNNKVNVSPEVIKMEKEELIEESVEAEEESPKIKRKVIKQKRRKRMRKIKKRKKARKYRGKCPSFIP